MLTRRLAAPVRASTSLELAFGCGHRLIVSGT
jgi:hypothetical protein